MAERAFDDPGGTDTEDRGTLRRFPSRSVQKGAELRLMLLGGFQSLRGTHVVSLPATAQRVLAFLALGERRRVERPSLAGSLWPEVAEARAAANLRSALWRIRKSDPGLVEVWGSAIALGTMVSVDVQDGVALARRLADPAAHIDAADLEHVELFGELLPNWYDEWTTPWRQRYDQIRVHALEALCERFAAAGRFERAVEVGLIAVSIQPLRESAHGAVIRAHVAEGNRGEALLQYRACREVLNRELGIEPSHELRELVEHLLAG